MTLRRAVVPATVLAILVALVAVPALPASAATTRYGVSIDGGDQYAGSRSVHLTFRTPADATSVSISNDRTFASGVRHVSVVDGTIPTQSWTLKPTGRATSRDVYVRFAGSTASGTYMDRIILDGVAPVIHSVTAKRSGHSVTFHISATDAISGVAYLAIGSSGAHPRPYTSTVTLVTDKDFVVLRVRDGEGKWTHWTQVDIP